MKNVKSKMIPFSIILFLNVSVCMAATVNGIPGEEVDSGTGRGSEPDGVYESLRTGVYYVPAGGTITINAGVPPENCIIM